jgi:hypothetical protein
VKDTGQNQGSTHHWSMRLLGLELVIREKISKSVYYEKVETI